MVWETGLEELTCTTHGRGLRRGGCWRVGGAGWRGDRGGKLGKL